MTTKTQQHRSSWIHSVLRRCLIAAITLVALMSDGIVSTATAQQEKPPIRMRLLPISVRNRSNGAIPVRMRLEYNQPQIVTGDVELVIYDGKNTTVPEDHIATMRFTDIVLPGQDYERIILLPPLRMGVQKTWSILASFTTKEGIRYPLSSSATQINPPMPHELLTTSPLDRGVLVCSCVSRLSSDLGSPSRQFLEKALSLENYNPVTNSDVGVARQTSAEVDRSVELIGRQIVHHNQEIAASDLPADPLSYCSFDLVLMTDGGLSSLKADQLTGIRKWVAAGGSVCILPDGTLKSLHADFLNSLLTEDNPTDTKFTLAEDGTLLVISEQPNAILKARYGIGRVVILPNDDALVARLSDRSQPAELGSIVGFLWKVNSDQKVHEGKLWGAANYNAMIMARMKDWGLTPQEDENGIYLIDPQQIQRYRAAIRQSINGRAYVNPMAVVGGIEGQASTGSLSPRNEPLLTSAQSVLLPENIQMVPTWIFAVILTAYVMTIGPVDYFVLGWLKLRKLTWVLFPVVTFFYTGLTVAVAWAYMASDDTGGRLFITDVGAKGVPLRQTTLETFYFGSSRIASRDLKNSIVVQGEQLQFNADYAWDMDRSKPKISPHAAMRYEGNFPQSFQVTQTVEQWSPLTIRSTTLEPENANVPNFDWDDPAIVNTEAGIAKLVKRIAELDSDAKANVSFVAAIYTASNSKLIYFPSGPLTGTGSYIADENGNPVFIQSALPGVLGSMPVCGSSMMGSGFNANPMPRMPGIFQVVSQIAPNSCTDLEDLNILDSSDPRQKVLVIVRHEGEDFHVFRKLYVMKDEK